MLMIAHTGVSVVNLLWNPGFAGIFAVCLSSGSVSVMELAEKGIKTLASLPGSIKANASKCKRMDISCRMQSGVPGICHLYSSLAFSNTL